MGARLASTARTAACNSIVDLVDVGSGTAKLQLWSGTRPVTPETTPAGTKLAEFSLPNPAFGAAVAGVATANAVTPVVGLADGTIAFARVLDRNGAGIWDNNSVGIDAENFVFNTLTVVTGTDVTLNSWTAAVPQGS